MGRALVFITAFILIAAAVIAGIWVMDSGTRPAPVATNQAATSTLRTALDSLRENATTQDYWNLLNKQVVEAACLEELKKAAGSNAWAVFRCSCSENATPLVKNYSCSVDTIAGDKSLSASCNKQEGKCGIEGEGQQVELTFEQIVSAIRRN